MSDVAHASCENAGKWAGDDARGGAWSAGDMRLPLEGTLLEKLRKIEALHAGTKIDGEREAARLAAEQIRAQLEELRGREPEEVMQYSLPDPWKRKLFLALCRRYGLKPYREPGQRHSTVLLRAPRTFQDRTLWPEYRALSKELNAHLEELTDRVIWEAIYEDLSEAADTAPARVLTGASADASADQAVKMAGVESGGSDERSPT